MAPPTVQFTLIQHFQFTFFVISIWGKRRLWAFAYAYTIYIAYQRVAIKHFQSIEMRYSPKTPEEDSVQQHLEPKRLGQASLAHRYATFLCSWDVEI